MNQRGLEPETLIVKGGIDPPSSLVRGYKVTDVIFSHNESCPTFMIANINPRSDIGYNLSRMGEIVKLAHQLNAEILIFPELSVSGYIWDAEHKTEVAEHLRASNNLQPNVKRVLDDIKADLNNGNDRLKMVIFGNVRLDTSHGKPHLHDSTFVITPCADCNEIFYDKIFLTPLEKLFFRRGTDERLILDTPCGRLGVMMCYDLCFG